MSKKKDRIQNLLDLERGFAFGNRNIRGQVVIQEKVFDKMHELTKQALKSEGISAIGVEK